MVIEELHVKNFGKLQNVKVPLREGFNLIYGPNESGKTTLHTFLKCMLFGMRRTRETTAENDVYSRYEPWEYSDYYTGSMRFSSGGKTFCLDRNFHRDHVNTELSCIADGEKIPVRRGELAALLGNISETVYDNTISFGQAKGMTDQELALELKNYTASYQGSAGSDPDLDKTLQILDGQKKMFEKELQLKKAQEESRKNAAASELLSLRQENQELHEKIQMEQQQLAQLEEQHKELENAAPPKILKKQKFRRRVLDIFLVCIALLMAAAAFLPKWVPAAAMIIAAGAFLEGGGLFFRRKTQKKIQAIQKRRQEDREMLARQIKRVKSRLRAQEEIYQEKNADQEALAKTLHAYNQETYQRDPIEEEIEGIELAIKALKETGERLQKELGGRIDRHISETLAELTKGKYQRIAADGSQPISVAAQGRDIPIAQLSRGTMAQVSFALRMAVGDILCSQEPLPVILDDVFVLYDEERLAETLQWLAAHRQQVLLFTSHKREQQILDSCKIPYYQADVFVSGKF